MIVLYSIKASVYVECMCVAVYSLISHLLLLFFTKTNEKLKDSLCLQH